MNIFNLSGGKILVHLHAFYKSFDPIIYTFHSISVITRQNILEGD